MLKILSTTLVLAAVVAYFGIERAAPNTEVTYITSPVEYGALSEEIVATGTVDALVKVDVSSQVSGRITKVNVDFNDPVSKGQPLAMIDQQGFDARVAETMAAVQIALAAVDVQQATSDRAAIDIKAAELEREVFRARIDQAKAALSAAQSKFERTEALKQRGTISAADIEDDLAALLSAEAQLREANALFATNEQRIESARADFVRTQAELAGARANVPQRKAVLQLAEVELERSTIRAPIDGIIIDRNIDEGQTVAATLEAPTLFTIAQALRDMVVHVNVDETDIGRIRIGQKAVFTVDAFPSKQFSGEVSEIRKSAKVFQNIVTYTVLLRTENPDDLLFPGMTALVSITVYESDPGLKIPTNSLSYSPSLIVETEHPQGSPFVWKLDQAGHPEPIAVSTRDRDTSHTIVVSEMLREGDQIIGSEILSPDSGGLFGLRLWE